MKDFFVLLQFQHYLSQSANIPSTCSSNNLLHLCTTILSEASPNMQPLTVQPIMRMVHYLIIGMHHTLEEELSTQF